MCTSKQKKTLLVIPARGGSKGVPGKNIRILSGKPLISHSIETALGVAEVLPSKVIVTTDSEQIIECAKKYPVEICKRPEDLAKDISNVSDAVAHVLDNLGEKKLVNFDIIVLLQPTSPLRKPKDVIDAVKQIREHNYCESVVSVSQVSDNHPARMYYVDNGGVLQPLEPRSMTKRRQELEKVYLRNGCIYALTLNKFKCTGRVINTDSCAYIMDERWDLNIDTERDFQYAEFIMPLWLKENE